MITPQMALERSNARSVLGVEKYASQTEIRSAWRRLTLETHPDQPHGSVEAFRHVNEAYELLKNEGHGGRWTPTSEPRFASQETSPIRQRPRVRTKIVEVSPMLADICRASLPKPESPQPSFCGAHSSNECDDGGQTTDHVPQSIRSKGRQFSYIVSSALRKGTNRVALPTGHLSGHRNERAELIQIEATRDGKSTLEVSKRTLETKFAGAERVRVHFANDEILC